MCGIVGYLGNRQATDVLVDGLSKLEYRGYDSAGVAVNNGKNELEIRKFQGRLAVLAEDLEKNPIKGHLGIGHTRWATHGVPSDVNSHPHFNKEKTIAVVHNGIIENYLELKAELQAEGYEFISQTDTEVVAHLVDKYYEGNLLDAVYKATARFRGAYALGVICTDNDQELVAVRKDSPLIVGLGEGENFIASDIPAILKYTRDVIFLENDEYVHMQGPKVTILDENKNVVEKKINEINWDIEAASKGGFDSFMAKEIYEQPKGVEDTLMRRLDENGRIKLDDIKITKEDLDKINKVYIVACGTAYHAGLVGKYAIEKFAKIPVIADIASEFRYSDPFVDENTLIFKKAMFWNVPEKDLSTEIKRVWTETVSRIKDNKYDNLPKASESSVLHVRPHDSKCRFNCPTPDGKLYKKQCFWFNKEYIKKQRPQKKSTVFCGWGGRIRTFGMTESESVALPLGDTPVLFIFVLLFDFRVIQLYYYSTI